MVSSRSSTLSCVTLPRMCSASRFWLVLSFSVVAVRVTPAQSVVTFPPPDAVLSDAKHKEPKSGVKMGPGNTISIQSGVGTPTVINVLAFSKDGKLIAAGKDFGRVVVWDVPSKKFVCAVETGQGIVRAVALSADGQLMATGGEGDRFSVKLWHLPDGRLVRTYGYFDGFPHTATFGPDGTWIVVSDNAGVTHVLDVATDKQLAELKGTYSPLLSPQGDVLMTVTKSSFILWSTSDWTQKRTMPRNPTYAMPLALSPERDSFIITSSGVFRLLRLSTGEPLPSIPNPELPKFNGAAGGFAAFGTGDVIFGHSDDRLWAWDTRSAKTCVSDLMYSESGSLSPDGKSLAGAKDNSILSQTRSGEGVWIWDAEKLAANCLDAAPAPATK
jgi:WD40 repeat protein